VDLPTYTNIWRIEKRLYKLYDFRLPMPLPVGQIAVFAAIAVPYVVILKMVGLPFSHTLLWLYILPPGALAWLVTRPVLEGKRLPELVVSQVRYLNEPRTWCRMAPLAERDEITVIARVWRRADTGVVAVSRPVAAAVEAVPGPAAAMEITSQRPALERHLPTHPVSAWPQPAAPAAPVREVGQPAARAVSVPPVRETPAPEPVGHVAAPPVPETRAPEPVRAVPVPPVHETSSQPAAGAVPAPLVRETPAPAVPVPPVHETSSQPAASAVPAPLVRETPAPEPARATPAPPARETSSQPAARAVPAPAAPSAPPPHPRPVVTVTGDQPGENPIRMVERALGNPSDRRSAGWHDRVVLVPGGHRPGRPDPLQRDRARARVPIPAGRRVVVLGCTVGAGQTVTALLTGELLASLRDDQVAVLDLNPGSGSLAERATTVPSLTGSGPPAPTRLEVVTREMAAAGGEDDVTKIFELLSARYPITLTDPGAAAVPRVLAAASQLIMVAPASQDAATALASTREWLEAHGHAELADGAITVLNGVSRHTMRHVEQAEALARGRCRAIIRIPWDDSLKNPGPERIAPPDQAAPMAGPAAGGLSQGALNAYTALAGVLVSALADAPEQQRARS
jgi:MinD-like ATPase involved in chromosome partitioning or flagellar assembly